MKIATKSNNRIIDAALFARSSEPDFLAEALTKPVNAQAVKLISDDANLLLDFPIVERHPLSEIELGEAAIDPHTVLKALRKLMISQEKSSITIVDMSWSAEAVSGEAVFESWGAITEQIAAETNGGLISLYNQELLIENQMHPTLQAHSQILAPSGIYDNPFWLPARLSTAASLDEQMAFLLGRAVPDYAGMELFDQSDRGHARGGDPDWLSQTRQIQLARPSSERWHIHCLGQLRVSIGGQKPVNWKLSGGAPNKTRTLFAYLLNSGEKGAHADRIGELLWPYDGSEGVKRSRLHHAVAMLRKTLGDKNSVIRSGEYYQLNAPVGSWTDISVFEQVCRRGLALAKQGQEEDALRIYRSGEHLYSGDLFADIPVEYVHSELEDWCLPRRRWLRQMAVKLFRDVSVLLRSQGQSGEALAPCLKALALDPTSEDTNCEAMRIFHAQGRHEAITRQYRQYLSAAEVIGGSPEGASIHRLHRTLMR